MSAEAVIARVRLTGRIDDVRTIASVPRCTCATNAFPQIVGGVYCCPCGWLSASNITGWLLRVRDEREYLDGQD